MIGSARHVRRACSGIEVDTLAKKRSEGKAPASYRVRIGGAKDVQKKQHVLRIGAPQPWAVIS
jgi:hypothetical protein